MDDATLICELLDGDPATVREVRNWIRGAFTPYRVRLASELEDLEQEILLELTLALREGKFEGQSRLETYVRTYVRYKCIDHLRARSRRQWVDVDDLELVSHAPSAVDEIARKDTLEQTLRVFEAVPESCRELWRMLEEGLSYREMSERLDLAEGTLRVRVSRCRKRALELRRELAEEDPGSVDGKKSGGIS